MSPSDAGAGAEPIDVLVPTCDRPAALAVALTALGAQTWPALRIVIADQSEGIGACLQGEVQAVLRYLRATGRGVETFRRLPRRGMAEQRAFLLAQARSRYCLFLDDDVIVEPDLVARLHAVLAREGCGFVGSALHGLSFLGQVRPFQEHIEFWEGPVQPEVVRPGSAAWARHHLHSAANLFHVQSRLRGDAPAETAGVAAGPADITRRYKVAWVGGCVMFDTAKLRDAGGFDFWQELPAQHCGEDVLAQQRVMARHGGCAILPSGAYHMELPTKVTARAIDAPYVLPLEPPADGRAVQRRGPVRMTRHAAMYSASMHGASFRLDGVDRIAVLRPNAVGDFMFALPALHALKAAYRQAELVFIGKPWHRDFLHGRPGPVDRVVVMPPVPGVGAPVAAAAAAAAADAVEGPATPEIAAFLESMREERFDLALQMFGSGRYSNAFVRQFGARVTAGSRAPGAPPLDRWVAYREPVPRRLALLEIAGLVGAGSDALQLNHQPNPPPKSPPDSPLPELSLTEADRIEAARVLPAGAGAGAGASAPLVVLQPGATDPRRRWPARHFAALGDTLAGQGATVLVHGARDEQALVDEVVGAMRHPAVPLAGRLSLGGLCGVLERTALLVSNDTGPLHLALALGVPSVGIFWLTNLIEGMPLRPSLLRAALSVRTRCPVCGVDNLGARCAHDPSFVADVSVEEVAVLARQALQESRPD